MVERPGTEPQSKMVERPGTEPQSKLSAQLLQCCPAACWLEAAGHLAGHAVPGSPRRLTAQTLSSSDHGRTRHLRGRFPCSA